MARRPKFLKKRFWKRYERQFLLALVIFLLATFSIGGALSCQDRGGGSLYKLGGEFLVSPSQREELSDTDYDKEFVRYSQYETTVRTPSLQYAPFFSRGMMQMDPYKATWAHILLWKMAEAAGYRAGPNQLRNVVRDIVAMRTNQPWSDIVYQNFLREAYRGSPAEFQSTTEQLVLKDMFLTPLVETSRYVVSYEEAYEQWKTQRERVELQYVSLPAQPFAERVELDERTRTNIAAQEKLLKDLVMASRQVKVLGAKIDSYKASHDDTYPADADAIVADPAMVLSSWPSDPWGHPVKYALVDGAPDVRSIGPDGEAGTPDDVTEETERVLRTQSQIYELARRIGQFRTAEERWPKDADELFTARAEGELPFIKSKIRDGWERDFVYAAAEGQAPTLTSLGADGEPGGGDDLTIALDPDAIRVAPAAALRPFLKADLLDAWDRPLDVSVEVANPLVWRVGSHGADGEPGTDDDLDEGNEAEIRNFYAQPEVKVQFRREPRRDLEVLYVHLPLIPDAILARMWEKYPEARPTDEDALFNLWSEYAFLYTAEDPRDPEKGHGAELVAKLKAEGVLAEDAPVALVPSADLFPKRLGAEAPGDDKPGDGEPGDDEPGDDEPGDGDEPGEADEDPAKDDPDRKRFQEKGWREILVRQRFMENVLNGLLQRLSASREAVREWEVLHGDKDETEPRPPRPEELTFEALLAGELSEFLTGAADADKGIQTFRYWRTEPGEPIDREAWEAHPEFGHPNLTSYLNRRTGKGEYAMIPVQVNDRLTKLLARNLEYHPIEEPQLEDIYEEVFAAYLEQKQMDRAEKELKRLQGEIEQAEKDDPEGGSAAALAAWAERVGVPYADERTGLYIADSPPGSVEPDEDADEDVVQAIRRRNFVWRLGYDTVKPTASRQDRVSAEPGTFGRRVLRDRPVDEGGSGSAFLVRVAAREYPSRYEFSPRRYADFLQERVFGGSRELMQGAPMKDLPGSFFQALSRYISDMEWLSVTFDLQTNSELDSFQRAP